MKTPYYKKKNYSSVSSYEQVKQYSNVLNIILTEDNKVKIIDTDTDETIKTFDDIGGEKIVEISTADGSLYIRNNLGNVYRHRLFENTTIFHKSNIIKMNGDEMVSFDKSYAYSTTSQQLVPIIASKYINVYEFGIKQKLDGTYEGIDYVPSGKVLKFITKDIYLTVENDLRRSDGSFVATNVINAGVLDYSRGNINKLVNVRHNSCKGSFNDWMQNHITEEIIGTIESGGNTGLDTDYDIKRFSVTPDIAHPSMSKFIVWYSTEDDNITLVDSDVKIGYVDSSENVTVDDVTTPLWDYWSTNSCENIIFVDKDVKSLSGTVTNLMLDKSIVIAFSSSEFKQL